MKLKKFISDIQTISESELYSIIPSITRRNLLITSTIILLLMFALVVGFVYGGSPSDDIYVIGIENDNEYENIVADSDEFLTTSPSIYEVEKGNQHIAINNTTIYYSDSNHGESALSALNDLIEEHNSNIDNDNENELIIEQDSVGGTEISDYDGSGSHSIAGIVTPLPFDILLYTIMLLIPLNFLGQIYATSLMRDKITNQNKLFKLAPVSDIGVLIGRLIPYVLIMGGVGFIIGFLTGAIISGVIASTLSGLFLFSAILFFSFGSKSYKGATFTTTSVTFVFIFILFAPALFANTYSISLISPLTIFIDSVGVGEYGLSEWVLSFIPIIFISTIFISASYILFTNKPYPSNNLFSNLINSISKSINSPLKIALLVTFLFPLIFFVQLLVLGTVIFIPEPFNIVFLFFALAFIEEVVKSIGIWYGISRNNLSSSYPYIVLYAIIAGVSFFTMEKIFHYYQLELFGLDGFVESITMVESVIGVSGTTISIIIFLMPLLLHTVTTTIASIGVKYGKKAYITTLVCATIFHMLYNITVVIIFA